VLVTETRGQLLMKLSLVELSLLKADTLLKQSAVVEGSKGLNSSMWMFEVSAELRASSL